MLNKVTTEVLYLSKKSDFLLLRSNGKRRRLSFGSVIYNAHPLDSKTRLGFAVSSKGCTAVVRNKIKRRIRASFREWAKEPRAALHALVIANSASLRVPHCQIYTELQRALT